MAVPTTITTPITDMATRNEVGGFPPAAYRVAVRAFGVLLGLCAIAWGGFFLPFFWHQASVRQVTVELLRGHAFKTQWLLEEAEQAAADQFPFCNPTNLHDAVVLRHAVLEEAMARGDQTLVSSTSSLLYDNSRTALACSPADSFVWLTLFWLDAVKRGVRPENERYLRLSYDLAPHEAWIALWRNRLSIAMFAQLPPDLADAAIEEFVKLVDTGMLYSETATIFISAAPGVRSLMSQQLRTGKLIPRQIFARTLNEKGFDFDIPGVEKPTRPWQ